MRLFNKGQKVILTVAVLVVATSMIGLGAYASFTSSTSATQSVASGTLTIALGATGAPSNRLNVNAVDIAPGDTIERSVNLTNSGSIGLSAITLSTVASPSSILDTDGTNGLQMKIESCSVAWVEGGTAPAYTYTCPGTVSTVLATRPVIGSALALSGLASVNPAASDQLRVTVSLPTSADNSFQGKSSGIQYTFTGTQRAGTSK